MSESAALQFEAQPADWKCRYCLRRSETATLSRREAQHKPCIVRPAARLPAQRLCAPERLLCSNSSIDDTTIRLPLPAPTPLFSLAHLRARSWHNSVVPERISAISKLVLTELIMIIQKCASQHWETSCISGNVAPNTATVSSWLAGQACPHKVGASVHQLSAGLFSF